MNRGNKSGGGGGSLIGVGMTSTYLHTTVILESIGNVQEITIH